MFYLSTNSGIGQPCIKFSLLNGTECIFPMIVKFKFLSLMLEVGQLRIT